LGEDDLELDDELDEDELDDDEFDDLDDDLIDLDDEYDIPTTTSGTSLRSRSVTTSRTAGKDGKGQLKGEMRKRARRSPHFAFPLSFLRLPSSGTARGVADTFNGLGPLAQVVRAHA